jgi:subtilisin family serine protease
MKKTSLAGILAMSMLAVILAAGCTSPTPSPSPSTTAQQTVSQFLGATMQQQGFTVVTPFAPQPSTPAGIAVYNGSVSDSNGTYLVSVRACDNAQTGQTQFTSLRDMYMSQGYTTVQQNATMWVGFNANTGTGAAVQHGISPLMPYYCMAITGGGSGYEQGMWMHMWEHMNEYHSNPYGYGMGPYMGYGMMDDTRSHMQEDMEEHMGMM